MPIAVLLALAGLAGPEPARAQVAEFDLPPIKTDARHVPAPGDKVLDIEVRSLGGINVADVKKLVEVKKGTPCSAAAVRKSIRLLYQTGLYSDVAVYAVRKPGGVIVVFELRARKRIEDIEIHGNAHISDLDVLRAMKVDRHDEFLPQNMAQMETDIVDLHRKAGFLQASVGIRAIQIPFTIRYKLIVQVTEGLPTTIEAIHFTGATHFPAAILIDDMGLDLGDRLDMTRAEKALERLREFYREKGFPFASVKKPAIKEAPGTTSAVVTIPVECGERTTFSFRGDTRVPVEDLRRVVRLAVAERELADFKPLAGKIKDYYVAKGFFNAAVTARKRVDDETGEATVTFAITEGRQVLVREVRFVGNEGLGAAKLEEFVTTFVAESRPVESVFERVRTEAVEGGLAERRQGYRARPRYAPSYEDDPLSSFVQEPYERASQALADYYRSLGYLDAKVSKAEFKFEKDNSRVIVTYRVSEGVRRFVKTVSFKGNKGLSSFFLLFKVRSMLGPHLDLYKVEEARLKLQSVYAEEGYIYAAIEEELKYSDDKTKTDIVYHVDEGVQVRVGRVVLQGNDATDDTVVADTITLSPGVVYRPSAAAESQANLLRLQVFQGASVALFDPDEMEAKKDLGVFLRERDPRSIEVRAGLSTQDGARVAVEYGHLNLFGKALEFGARVKLGYQVFAYVPGYLDDTVAEEFQNLKMIEAVAREEGVSLNLPKIYGIPFNTSARFDLVNERVNERAYFMDRIAATPGIEVKILEPLTFLLSYSVEYKFLTQTNAYKNKTDAEKAALTLQERQLADSAGLQWLGSARPTMALDMRDDKFNPHKGLLVSVGLEYTRSLAAPKKGEINFVKANATATFYVPTSRKTTLALQVGAGDIATIGGSSSATPDAVFYLGGRSTLRGFADKAVWAADASEAAKHGEGGVVAPSSGGNAYVLYKAEFRFPIRGGVEGGLFVDAGNLWVDYANFNPVRLRPCAGFGLRYKTPVGPLSLDFGINLLPDSTISESAGAWSFSVGMF